MHAAGMAMAEQRIGYCIHQISTPQISCMQLHEEHGVMNAMWTHKMNYFRKFVLIMPFFKVTSIHMKQTRPSIQVDGAYFEVTLSPQHGVLSDAHHNIITTWRGLLSCVCILCSPTFSFIYQIHINLLHFALNNLVDKAASFNVIRALSQFLLHHFLLSPSELDCSQVIK
jgi:hypothetical protein